MAPAASVWRMEERESARGRQLAVMVLCGSRIRSAVPAPPPQRDAGGGGTTWGSGFTESDMGLAGRGPHMTGSFLLEFRQTSGIKSY